MKIFFLLLAVAGCCFLAADGVLAAAPEPTTLYATGFEADEGYDDTRDLAGQLNWFAFGTGGNGLVSNSFAGLGWQAYIGFTPPQGSNDFFNLLQPLNFVPDTNVAPVMGGEDFSFMLEARPGAFIFVGNGDTANVHHPAYNFDDDVIPVGVSYWAKLVETAMPA